MNQAQLKEGEVAGNVEETEERQSFDLPGHEDGHGHEHALNWREINRVLFVASAAAAIWFLGGARNPYITGIGVICTLVGGFPIFHEAYENIVQRRMTMRTLDGHCHRGGTRDPRNIHCIGYHLVCTRCRDS